MATFSKDGFRTPLARNQYLRSTQDVKTVSRTLAKSTITSQTIDGHAGQKIVQPGTVLATITSGPQAGKVGPVMAGATDGRQTLTNIVGICNTFLPWQTIERDVDVAVVYEAAVVQANCLEYDAAGLAIALTDTTAAGMVAKKNIDIRFAV